MRTARWAVRVGATAAILAGGFLTPAVAVADGWYDVAWPYRKPLTIQAAQVAGSLTAFPVLVQLTSDADLAGAAQAAGADILFTAGDGVTKLDHEIESYTPTTGALVAWVKVPTLSSTSDTALYLYYGNPAAPNQQNASGVWSANYGAVWHLSQSAAPYLDSTSNANHSSGGTDPAQVNGVIHKGQSFNGSSHVIRVSAATSIELTNNGTVSAWFRFGTSKQSNLLEKGGANGYALWQDGTKIRWGKQNSSVWATSTVSYNIGQWYKVDGVADAGVMRLYINGVLNASSSSSASFTNTGTLQIGNGVDGRYQGILDEIRISSAVRTAQWIATEYNNQSSPSTFYALGSPVSVPTVTFTAAVSEAAEDAGVVTVRVQLSAAMPYDVEVPFSIGGTASDPADYTAAAGPLTIPAGSTGVDMIVTVIDNDIDESDETVIITLGSPTGAILGATSVHTLTITDDDTAGVTVSPVSGLVTTEAGGTATFTVQLTSEPTAAVVITLSSSDATEGTVAPDALTFTAADWSTPQAATVTGVDDAVADGDTAYNVVTLPAVSTDPAYDGLDAADVSVTNTDDDTAGITLHPTAGLVTTEAGGTATFTVQLTSEPTAAVVITLSSSDATEGTVAPDALTFTAADWSTPQAVTVTGVDDAVADGDTAYNVVTLPAVSTDPAYDGLDAADVSVTNLDDDPADETGPEPPPTGVLPPSDPPPAGPNPPVEAGDTGPRPIYDEVITVTRYFLPVQVCGAVPLAYLAATTTSLVAMKRLRRGHAATRFGDPAASRSQPRTAGPSPHGSRDCREKP